MAWTPPTLRKPVPTCWACGACRCRSWKRWRSIASRAVAAPPGSGLPAPCTWPRPWSVANRWTRPTWNRSACATGCRSGRRCWSRTWRGRHSPAHVPGRHGPGSWKRSTPPGPNMRNGSDSSRIPRLAWTTKWRCGPLLKPVLPESPRRSPRRTRSPGRTNTPLASRCAYRAMVPSSWSTRTKLARPSRRGSAAPWVKPASTCITTPSRAATTGVPTGAVRSMAWRLAASRWLLAPPQPCAIRTGAPSSGQPYSTSTVRTFGWPGTARRSRWAPRAGEGPTRATRVRPRAGTVARAGSAGSEGGTSPVACSMTSMGPASRFSAHARVAPSRGSSTSFATGAGSPDTSAGCRPWAAAARQPISSTAMALVGKLRIAALSPRRPCPGANVSHQLKPAITQQPGQVALEVGHQCLHPGRRGGAEHRPAIAAVALDAVERLVGQFHHRFPAQRGALVAEQRVFGQAHGGSHLDAAAVADVERRMADGVAQALAHGRHLRGRHRPEHQQEFFAPPAHHVVSRAHQPLQAHCRFRQHTVAGGVAVDIVDLLEMVQVEQREHDHVRGRGRELAVVVVEIDRDLLHQVAAVVQAGQRVGQAGQFQLAVGFGQLRGALVHQPLQLGLAQAVAVALVAEARVDQQQRRSGEQQAEGGGLVEPGAEG